jgi:hypothetical protein
MSSLRKEAVLCNEFEDPKDGRPDAERSRGNSRIPRMIMSAYFKKSQGQSFAT